MKKKGYAKGGMKKGYAKGGMKKGYAAGGMKPVPEDNTGLKKLPSNVRNKMGFMNKGSLATKKKSKNMPKGGKGVIVVSIGIGKVKKSKKKKTTKKS